jgi:hypothetical protein
LHLTVLDKVISMLVAPLKFIYSSIQVSDVLVLSGSMARPRVADGRDGLQLEVSCEYIE